MMDFYSIDIETTGLDPETGEILEIAVVEVVDWKIKRRVRLVNKLEIGNWSTYCILMHMDTGLIAEIQYAINHDVAHGAHCPYTVYFNTCAEAMNWLVEGFEWSPDRKIILAGKNVAKFDLPWLDYHLDFSSYVGHHHRILDPAALYMKSSDTEPPKLATCVERAGLPVSKDHTALDDAMAVAKLFCKVFG
jgi:DNA polymerase III epsilon subunit-like protein